MATWYEDLWNQVNGSGQTANQYVGSRLYHLGQDMNGFGDWLGLSRADKNELEYVATGFPILGDIIRARDDYNYMDDYMRNKGLSWADVRYPSTLRGAGSIGRAVTSVPRFVSENVKDLYELDELRTRRTTKKLIRQQTSQKRYRW